MRGRKPSSLSKDNGLRKLPPAPAWLPVEGKTEWKRVAPALGKREVLTEADLGSLENYCLAIGTIRQCQTVIDKEGMFVSSERSAPRPHPAIRVRDEAMRQARQLAAELGLTPVSRSRPALAPQGEDDEFKRAGMDI